MSLDLEHRRDRLNESEERRKEDRDAQTKQLDKIREEALQQPIRKRFDNKFITYDDFVKLRGTGGLAWETMDVHPDDSERYQRAVAAHFNTDRERAMGRAMPGPGGRKLKHRRKSRRRNKSRRHRK